MAGGKTIVFNIKLETQSNFKKQEGAITKMNRSLDRLGYHMARTSALFERYLVKPLKNLSLEAIETANTFDKAFGEIQTLTTGTLDQSTARMMEFMDALEDMSTTYMRSVDDLASGLYEYISAFGDTANTLKGFEIATRMATTGFSSTTEAVDLLTTVGIAFNDTTLEMQDRIADLSFELVRLSKTHIYEIGENIGKLAAAASLSGVAIEEMYSATATLIGVTGDTTEVFTQLRRAVLSLQKPNTTMVSLLQNLGYEGARAGRRLIGEEGLVNALTMLLNEAQAAGVSIEKAMGRIQGIMPIFALSSKQIQNRAEVMRKYMNNAEGSMDRAFEKLREGIASQALEWEMISKRLENQMAELGRKIIPYLSDIKMAISDMFQALLDKDTIPAMDTLVDLFDRLTNIIKKLPKFATDIIQKFMTWGIVMTPIAALLSAIIFSYVTIIPIMGKFVSQVIKTTIALKAMSKEGLLRAIFSLSRWSNIIKGQALPNMSKLQAHILKLTTLLKGQSSVIDANGKTINFQYSGLALKIKKLLKVFGGLKKLLLSFSVVLGVIAAIVFAIRKVRERTEEMSEAFEDSKDTAVSSLHETSIALRNLERDMDSVIERADAMSDSLTLATEGAAEKISFYTYQDFLGKIDTSIEKLKEGQQLYKDQATSVISEYINSVDIEPKKLRGYVIETVEEQKENLRASFQEAFDSGDLDLNFLDKLTKSKGEIELLGQLAGFHEELVKAEGGVKALTESKAELLELGDSEAPFDPILGALERMNKLTKGTDIVMSLGDLVDPKVADQVEAVGSKTTTIYAEAVDKINDRIDSIDDLQGSLKAERDALIEKAHSNNGLSETEEELKKSLDHTIETLTVQKSQMEESIETVKDFASESQAFAKSMVDAFEGERQYEDLQLGLEEANAKLKTAFSNENTALVQKLQIVVADLTKDIEKYEDSLESVNAENLKAALNLDWVPDLDFEQEIDPFADINAENLIDWEDKVKSSYENIENIMSDVSNRDAEAGVKLDFEFGGKKFNKTKAEMLDYLEFAKDKLMEYCESQSKSVEEARKELAVRKEVKGYLFDINSLTTDQFYLVQDTFNKMERTANLEDLRDDLTKAINIKLKEGTAEYERAITLLKAVNSELDDTEDKIREIVASAGLIEFSVDAKTGEDFNIGLTDDGLEQLKAFADASKYSIELIPNLIKETFPNAWDTVKEKVGQVGNFIADSAKFVGETFRIISNKIVEKVPFIGQAIEWTGEKLGAAGTWIGDKLKGAGSWVIEKMKGFGNALGPLGEMFLGGLMELESIQKVLNPFATIIQKVFEILQPSIDRILMPLMDVFNEIAMQIAVALIPIMNSLAPIILEVARMLGPLLTPILGILVPIFNVIATILELLTPVLKVVVTAVIGVMLPFQYLAEYINFVTTNLKAFGELLSNIAKHPLRPGKWNKGIDWYSFGELKDSLSEITKEAGKAIEEVWTDPEKGAGPGGAELTAGDLKMPVEDTPESDRDGANIETINQTNYIEINVGAVAGDFDHFVLMVQERMRELMETA